MTRPLARRTALPALLLCALVGASAPARAEDCTKAYKLRGGQWIDPETGAVVPPCDGDALPTPDVLWLLQREGRATEAVSALEIAKQELAAERDLHKADVERERAPRRSDGSKRDDGDGVRHRFLAGEAATIAQPRAAVIVGGA